MKKVGLIFLMVFVMILSASKVSAFTNITTWLQSDYTGDTSCLGTSITGLNRYCVNITFKVNATQFALNVTTNGNSIPNSIFQICEDATPQGNKCNCVVGTELNVTYNGKKEITIGDNAVMDTMTYATDSSKRYWFRFGGNNNQDVGLCSWDNPGQSDIMFTAGDNSSYGNLSWNATINRNWIYLLWNVIADNSSLDSIAPEVNMSINDTSLVANDGVNVSANLSDNKGLSFCRFVINQSAGGIKEFFNKSVTGTDDKCSQNFTIRAENVINFTLIVNDTSNNLAQKEQIITISDTTPPTINYANWSLLSITNGDKINVTVNVTDNNILNQINITARSPTGVLFNRSCISLTTSSFFCNITFFDGDETAENGVWNLTIASSLDSSSNLITTYPNATMTTNAASGGGGGSSGSGGGGGGGLPSQPKCKENEILISNICTNATLFNVTLKVIGLTNIQPIVFYRTCGKFQEFRQLIKTSKILKSAEFEKKQPNTNITIIGSDVLIVKKLKISGIAQRIDMGYLKLTDVTQQVARVFISLRIVSLCNPLTYIFIAVPTIIIIFRKKIAKFIKKK